ncbi:DUF1680-domain-containing protein [Hypomontagnella submonticulosa]|nr:DUF1680-domain-containing protein [Hypomontagnella submonticulosa]
MSHPQSVFKQTAFHGKSMLSVRRNTISKIAIRTQLAQLRSTGRYDCFKLKWHPIYADKSMWPVPFHLFWDSDIAKWIEGACYFLEYEYDEELNKAIQELVEMIRDAQQEDGYLNVHYQVVEPGKRWTNLRDMHELYNAGHLIEAALAHRQYYNSDRLLEPIQKYVAHIRKTFGPADNQLHGYPGHPEIELALLRLHAATGSQDAYELAQFFIEERGNTKGQDGKHYYDWETERRGETFWQRSDAYSESRAYWVCQAHAPILEQQAIEGHAVRGLYLCVGAADMVYLGKQAGKPISDEWAKALLRLWDNMVDRKMYLTGGVGAIKQWEGFGIDYFLPQGTDEGGCYGETCAGIAVMMLAERLLHLELDGRFADVMELCLYNNVMTAMSLDGKAFTYVNQLASSETDKSVRYEWFWCACCPPNLARLFGSLGGYLWDYGAGGSPDEAFINVHLYTSAKVTFDVDGKPVFLEQQSNWPWEGTVKFQLTAPSSLQTTLRLRLPEWCDGRYTLTPAPEPSQVTVSKGYLTLAAAYTTENPSFTLEILNFTPRHILPHPYTNQRTLTLARGPIVYCAEDADNAWEENHFKDIVIKADSPVKEEKRVHKPTGEEYVALRTMCWTRSVVSWPERGPGGHAKKVKERLCQEWEIVLVPYYFRANRGGKGHMRVGLIRG